MESLVNTKESMFVLAPSMVKELKIMHLIDGYESYKTALGVVMHVLGRIEGLPIQIRETKCNTVFMVVNTNNYDVILGLHFLIKIGIVVDVEKGLIYVRQGLGSNVQVLPFNMVNMLKLMVEQPSHSKKYITQITLTFSHLSLVDKME
jgi:hypothetical protein